jgi:hypothetical protein
MNNFSYFFVKVFAFPGTRDVSSQSRRCNFIVSCGENLIPADKICSSLTEQIPAHHPSEYSLLSYVRAVNIFSVFW